jgi:hypothetical protein
MLTLNANLPNLVVVSFRSRSRGARSRGAA